VRTTQNGPQSGRVGNSAAEADRLIAALRRTTTNFWSQAGKTAAPITWKYADPTRQVRANLSTVTVH